MESNRLQFWYGMIFTLLIAIISFGIARLPVFNYIGPLATAITLAFIYRQLFGYPYKLKAGIQFSAKILLRAAIVLYGLKLNINVVFSEGLPLLLKSSVVIAFAILMSYALAKLFKADMTLSMLLGVGTGVCGAAAIAAVAPIIKAKDEDTAVSVGIIALLGTIFSVVYLLIRPYVPIEDVAYGIWSGLSLHELAHVALAAEPAGEEALGFALLAKLSRVFLLVPLCLIFIWYMRRKESRTGGAKVAFPYFLIGFILMSLLNSYVIGDYIEISAQIMDSISQLTTLLLTMAMIALGLNISIKDMAGRTLKPFVLILIISILLSVLVYQIK
ncbi:putative sulfate exporter family transporter [Salinicoccus cyprini]|uniref:Putative sulfate exporter family transporter n=1 Tax=Salinicoccus cyprini TaxID=2493691 RepID=A0A558AV69_9STAP|nr:putative sulfate exporter family transporter [Salinicoccus cyprini]TVT28162.1 putative sulfate exporter family transporter [Salinicoccus cyprini]